MRTAPATLHVIAYTSRRIRAGAPIITVGSPNIFRGSSALGRWRSSNRESPSARWPLKQIATVLLRRRSPVVAILHKWPESVAEAIKRRGSAGVTRWSVRRMLRYLDSAGHDVAQWLTRRLFSRLQAEPRCNREFAETYLFLRLGQPIGEVLRAAGHHGCTTLTPSASAGAR